MNRGVQRNSKKAARPTKSKKLPPAIEGDPSKWAKTEIRKTTAFIDQGNAYLEKQFERALQEPDNSVEILRLQKAFEGRQDRALKVLKEMEQSVVVAPQQEGNSRRGRLDLRNPLGAEDPDEE
ncbi:MAG: hypothetical protein ACE5D3_00025 [Candidatus Binatia bacterium]